MDSGEQLPSQRRVSYHGLLLSLEQADLACPKVFDLGEEGLGKRPNIPLCFGRAGLHRGCIRGARGEQTRQSGNASDHPDRGGREGAPTKEGPTAETLPPASRRRGRLGVLGQTH